MKEEEKPQKNDAVLKEEKILKFWQDNKIFEKTLEKPAPNGNFVFFDGPPFATGTPHYGHILAGTIKDIIPRYQTMIGKKVLRRWGWDCHGLPIENLVEKELGLQSKKDIEVFGVEKFNKAARGMVMRYANEWKKVIPRVGRWVDMENDYKTMDTTYTESVWWSFKNLYDKGLVYKGFKSMQICPHCETTLSNFEINQGYKDITDISVYVKFELENELNTYLIAWTTTPWTLPGNVALAVNKNVAYVKVQKEDKFYILAKDLAEKVLKENSTVVEEFSGEKLIGLSYTPVFSYYNNSKLENKENGFKVYHGDFVTVEDGTGIVHIAPAFGEEDMILGKENNLPFIQHVAFDGTFKPEVTDFAGQKVKPKEDHQKADIEIIKYLAGTGALFAKEKIIHSYPHCWRCDTPLLNYATTSWFVNVGKLKDRMIEINKRIEWNPKEIGEGRFGKGLESAPDWSVSRSRYWGAPLPVWVSKDGDFTVLGSISDLKDGIGRRNSYLLMRHGESESNANGGIISSKKENNDHLTSKGKEQVFASAESIKDTENIDLIISSPFMRTKETAEIMAEELGLNKNDIVYDERLGEIFCGENEGTLWKDFVIKNFSGKEERFEKKVDGAETLDDVRQRMMEFFYDIDKKYEGKKMLIVSHAGPINLALLSSEGLSKKEIIKKYFDFSYDNAKIKKCDFVALPHNETFEIDLHRPYIDEVVIKNEKGEELHRIPEVFDTWYDSGSMPFAQQHYPFENKEEFERENSSLFPADFIAEGQDQTRGWFYTLLVLSTGLFNKSSYKHVMVNGLVLAEDGKKMSKSLKNYPDLMDVINKYTADAMRYYMVASPIVHAEDLNFSEKGVDEVYKKIVQKIYNVLSFYEMYGVTNPTTPKKFDVLDKWIFARLAELRDTVTLYLDKHELDKASRPIMDFVDDLSTWYLRRSRDRFKSEGSKEVEIVSYSMKFVLIELSKIIAPFMPFLSEEVYLRLTKGEIKESVHLEDWPELLDIPRDTDLIKEMVSVRSVVTSVLEMRQKSGVKVRQPLSSVTITEKFSKELENIISDELNVKEVIVGKELSLDTKITEDLKREGVAREIIRGIQDMRKKENLNPSDRINIDVNSNNDIKKIFEEYEEMIKFPTGVVEINFVNDKQNYEIDLEDGKISISIV